MDEAAIGDYTDAARKAWNRLRPSEDMTAFDITTRVQRLSALMAARLDEVARAHGFDVYGDFAVAAAVRRAHRDVTPSDLAEQLLVTRAGVTGRLKRLDEAGFLVRQTSELDGRQVTLRLTPLGRRRVDAAFSDMQSERTRALSALDLHSQRSLADMLRRVLLAVEPSLADNSSSAE